MNPSEFSKQVEQVGPEIDQPELDNAFVSFLESSNMVEQIDFDTTINNTVAIDRSPYWKTQKQVKRKTKFKANHPVFDFITIQKPTR